ncbi:MAG: hypothetical protein FJ290_30865 [Planctomycetes bacterium]|nr:hypothetical protein [Planctomycetota bacterium]
MAEAAANPSHAQTRLRSDAFDVALEAGAIVGLRRVNDAFDTDYILAGGRFGDLVVRYRRGDGQWQPVTTAELAEKRLFRETIEARL